MFRYNCQSCGAVGELDEEVEQVPCPQCGGTMTINRNIKVAKPVDKGFGNMLARSTGPFAPLGKRDLQAKPPPPTAPPPPPPPPPPPQPQRSGSSTGIHPGGGRKFTINKTRPTNTRIGQGAASSTNLSTKSAVHKANVSFKKRPQTAPAPAPAPAPPPGPIMGIPVNQPTTVPPPNPALQQSAQLQQQLETERRARIQAEQEALARRQADEQEAARQESIRIEAQRLAEERVREAREEAERRIAEERAKARQIAAEEAERARQLTAEAARLAAQQATAELQARIEQERRQEAERIRREQEEAERRQRDIEQTKKNDAEFLRKTVSEAVAASAKMMPTPTPSDPPATPPPSPGSSATQPPVAGNKDAADNIPKGNVLPDAAKPADQTKIDAAKPGDQTTSPAADAKKADATSGDPQSTEQPKPDRDKPGDPSKPTTAKGKMPLPPRYGKKKRQPHPIPMKKAAGTKPEGKVGDAKPEDKTAGIKPEDKAGDDAKKVDAKAKPTRTATQIKGIDITHTGLLRMQRRKRNTIYIIVGAIVVLSLVPIFFGARWLRSAMHGGRKKSPAKTERSHRTSPGGMLQQVSPYQQEFLQIKGKLRDMPMQTGAQIDAIIAVWREFLDSHPDADPEDTVIKQANESLKHLRDLRAMY